MVISLTSFAGRTQTQRLSHRWRRRWEICPGLVALGSSVPPGKLAVAPFTL